MARIIHEVVQGGPPPGATDSWWVTAAIRQALEEKREARADRDLHQREAIRALQRADQAEREREQYIKGGWYEEYQKRLDALLAENSKLREALHKYAPSCVCREPPLRDHAGFLIHDEICKEHRALLTEEPTDD
jgi:hypothetical protein